MRILISYLPSLFRLQKYEKIQMYQILESHQNYQNDKSFSFIYPILIVLLEYSACLALYQINNLVIKMVVLYEILVLNK